MGTNNITAYSGELSTGTSAKTMLQLLAPATDDLLIEEIRTSGKAAPSNTSHTAILWTIAKQTTAGTMSDVTEVAWPGATSATALGTATKNATAEPTTTDEYLHWETPTTAPGYTWRGALFVPAGTRIGVIATSANDVTAIVELVYRRA